MYNSGSYAGELLGQFIPSQVSRCWEEDSTKEAFPYIRHFVLDGFALSRSLALFWEKKVQRKNKFLVTKYTFTVRSVRK